MIVRRSEYLYNQLTTGDVIWKTKKEAITVQRTMVLNPEDIHADISTSKVMKYCFNYVQPLSLKIYILHFVP